MLLTPLIHEPTRTPFHTPGNLWVTRWKLQASWNLQTITGLWGPWACQRQSFGLGYRWEIGVLNTWVFQTQYFQFNSPDSHNKYNLEFEYYKKNAFTLKGYCKMKDLYYLACEIMNFVLLLIILITVIFQKSRMQCNEFSTYAI